jgi:hypothetical protein
MLYFLLPTLNSVESVQIRAKIVTSGIKASFCSRQPPEPWFDTMLQDQAKLFQKLAGDKLCRSKFVGINRLNPTWPFLHKEECDVRDWMMRALG